MQLFEVFGEIIIRDQGARDSLSNLDRLVDRAQAGIHQFGSNLMEIGGRLSNFGNSLIENVSKPLINLAKDSIFTASDIKEAFNVIDVTFGKNANEVVKWSEGLLNDFGLVKLESMNYVGSMGAMLKSSGLSASASENMSKKLVELAGDFSSFYNLGHEATWEKIRSGISGKKLLRLLEIAS